MARFGKINQKRFDNTDGTDGQVLKRVAGIYTPSNESSGASVTNRSQLLVTASRNLDATDAGKHLYSTNGTPFNLTIPNSVFAANDEIEIAADGAGSINLIPGSGFTINGSSATVTALSGTAGFLKFRSPSSAQWYGVSPPVFTTDYQESGIKPTTRKNGVSALQSGDRWYDTASHSLWYYDTKPNAVGGNFSGWFEFGELRSNGFGLLESATLLYIPCAGIPAPTAAKAIYIASFDYAVARFAPQNATDNWLLRSQRVTAVDVQTTLAQITLTTSLGSGVDQPAGSLTVNQVLTTASASAKVRFYIQKNGNAGKLGDSGLWFRWCFCR
jgi:hypothetical protein